MTWLSLAVIALVVGFLPQATAAAPNAADPVARAAATGSITGQVTDAFGAPVEGATVSASSYDDYLSGETDESGTYRITGVAAADYVVQFSAEGYFDQYFDGVTDWEAATPVSVTAGIEASGIDATLDGGASISGTVTDEAGQPIEGVDVSVQSEDGDSEWAQTAEDGSYAVSRLRAGSHIVAFEAESFVTQYFDGVTDRSSATPIRLESGDVQSGIDAVLDRGATISGTVTDEAGQPVEGAAVLADGDDGYRYASTTADGSYALSGLAPGSYAISFYMGGYVTQFFDGVTDREAHTPVVVAEDDEVSGIDAVLDRGASISGTVTDVSGQPIEGVSVSTDGGGTTTAADGSYSVSGLLPQSYTVSFEKEGYLRQYFDGVTEWESATPVSITAADGEVTDIDAVLDRTGSVSGVVTDAAGLPVEGVSVWASAAEGAGYSSTAVDGSYTVSGLPPGSYAISFSKSGYVGGYYDGVPDWESHTPVPVTANGVVTGIDAVLGRGASISGTVTDASGEPLRGVSVAAFDYPYGQLAFTTTASDGTYTVSALSPGSYAMQFTLEGHVTQYYDGTTDFGAWTPVVVTGDDVVSGIDAMLDRGVAISGTVTDASGRPVEDVTVTLDGPSNATASTGSDGTYVASGLAPGTYTVSFERFGYVDQFYDAAPDRATATPVTVLPETDVTGVDASLALGRKAISGRVTDAVGDPIAGATVTAFGPSIGQATTSADGTYALWDLDVGSYFLAFEADGFMATYATQIFVSDWAPTTGVDAMLDPAPVVSDLGVAVSTSAPEVAVGDLVTYQLAVHEVGDGPAPGVVVTGTVPDELEVVSARRGWFGVPCDISGQAVSCTIPSLSGSTFVTVTARALTPGTGLGFSATVSGAGFDPDLSSNSSSVSVDVVADRVPVDLAISAAASTSEAVVGQTFSYTLAVRNPGRQVATSVVVTDTVPDAVEVVSASYGFLGTPCAVDDRAVTCALGSVATSQFIEIEVRALTAGAAENEATVDADAPDPDPANNRATVTVDVAEVASPIDVALYAYASATEVRVGDTFTYGLLVDNQGGRSAAGVSVTDAVPANLEVLSVTRGWFGTPCGAPTQTVTCSLGSVADYQFVTVTVRALAPGAGIVNAASVSIAGGDTDPTNDTASVAVTITP